MTSRTPRGTSWSSVIVILVVALEICHVHCGTAWPPPHSSYVFSEDLQTHLPPHAGHGFRRQLMQRKPIKIKLGYSGKAQIRPKAGKDTLASFNKAFAQLLAAGGGELNIEQGTYLVKGQLILKASNVLIKGAGMDKTIIKLANRSDKPWKQAGFFRATSVKGVTLADLTLDGNKSKQKNSLDEAFLYGRYGIYMDDFQNVAYQRIRAQNFQRYGIDPHGVKRRGNFIWSYNLTVIDCIANDNNWDGFTFDQTINVYARNNTSIRNGRYGFDVCTASKNVLLEYNRAIGNGFGPMNITKGGPQELERPGCQYAFLDVNRTSCGCPNFPGQTENIVARYNTASGGSVAGFCTYRVKNATMIGNTVTNTPHCGIFMANTVGSFFTNNTCKSTPKKVVYFNTTLDGVKESGTVYQ